MDNSTLASGEKLIIPVLNAVDPLYLNIRHSKKCPNLKL